MDIYIMHPGLGKHEDLDLTVKKRVSLSKFLDIANQFPSEKAYFQNNKKLFHEYFPSGYFNCWGVPPNSEYEFRKLREGNAVLFIPYIRANDGRFEYICKAKLICPNPCPEISRKLWPDTTTGTTRFPWLFFFDAYYGDYPLHDYLRYTHYPLRHVRARAGQFYCVPPYRLRNDTSGFFEMVRASGGFRQVTST